MNLNAMCDELEKIAASYEKTKKAGELSALAGMMANSPVLRAQRATQAYKKNKQEIR